MYVVACCQAEDVEQTDHSLDREFLATQPCACHRDRPPQSVHWHDCGNHEIVTLLRSRLLGTTKQTQDITPHEAALPSRKQALRLEGSRSQQALSMTAVRDASVEHARTQASFQSC